MAKVKKTQVTTKTFDVSTGTCVVTFVESGKKFSFKLEDFPKEIQSFAALQGIFAKGTGAYNNSPDDKETVFQDTLARLMEGKWNALREGGDGTSGVGMLPKVMHYMTGGMAGGKEVDLAYFVDYVGELSDEQKQGILNDSRYRLASVEYKAKIAEEKAGEDGVGASGALDDLLG